MGWVSLAKDSMGFRRGAANLAAVYLTACFSSVLWLKPKRKFYHIDTALSNVRAGHRAVAILQPQGVESLRKHRLPLWRVVPFVYDVGRSFWAVSQRTQGSTTTQTSREFRI